MKISPAELMHHRIQAIIRDVEETHRSEFDGVELLYLGEREGKWWYMIGGIPVSTEEIEKFEEKV